VLQVVISGALWTWLLIDLEVYFGILACSLGGLFCTSVSLSSLQFLLEE